ncbi:hypothetical protein [Amycolatopsis sp. NPDC001319]|uniref:hypothetical protein n=1 Tax=unclassified Amycolatopsis TaxID=2618356 RepID=UPI0036948B98
MRTDDVNPGVAAARRLAELGCCTIAPSLTDAEFARIEAEHGFEFADDHRAFLAAGLPMNSPFVPEPDTWTTWEKPWPEWRDGDAAELRKQLDWPVDYLLWDIDKIGYWRPDWGTRPESLDAALQVARLALADVPRLVPVYAHRFLPAGRGTSGHPVLSVRGTDTIYFGTDLAEYIDREFEEPAPELPDDWSPQATVPFWRDYVAPPFTGRTTT